MTYQDQLEEQAASVSAQVLAALALYEAGRLTADALAGVVAVQTGTPAAPLGITRPTDDPERLARATATIRGDLDRHRLTDPEAALTTAQTRFLRLAEAEIKEAATRAFSEAAKRSTSVTGWRRGLKSDACQLCRWWSREGRIWDADHPMPTHKGCTCSQLIITRKEAAA